MQDDGLDQEYVQRCRNVWWTVYILDRQMSTLMGVPSGLKDEEISASFPTSSTSSSKNLALELNVRLSGILSQIMNSKSKFCSRNRTNNIHSCVWNRRTSEQEVHPQHQECSKSDRQRHYSVKDVV